MRLAAGCAIARDRVIPYTAPSGAIQISLPRTTRFSGAILEQGQGAFGAICSGLRSPAKTFTVRPTPHRRVRDSPASRTRPILACRSGLQQLAHMFITTRFVATGAQFRVRKKHLAVPRDESTGGAERASIALANTRTNTASARPFPFPSPPPRRGLPRHSPCVGHEPDLTRRHYLAGRALQKKLELPCQCSSASQRRNANLLFLARQFARRPSAMPAGPLSAASASITHLRHGP